MFPGKILQLLYTERFQIIQLFVTDTVLNRFYVAPVDAHEKNVENRSDHMEVLSQGQKAEEIEKGDIVNIIHHQMHLL